MTLGQLRVAVAELGRSGARDDQDVVAVMDHDEPELPPVWICGGLPIKSIAPRQQPAPPPAPKPDIRVVFDYYGYGVEYQDRNRPSLFASIVDAMGTRGDGPLTVAVTAGDETARNAVLMAAFVRRGTFPDAGEVTIVEEPAAAGGED